MEREHYVRTVVDFLELLPPGCLVERISGEAPPDYLVGPAWCLDKPGIRGALDAEFRRRDTWQGRKYNCSVPCLHRH
jgi:radical SAM superfamily enzyme